jgi:hypothetical protein
MKSHFAWALILAPILDPQNQKFRLKILVAFANVAPLHTLAVDLMSPNKKTP